MAKSKTSFKPGVSGNPFGRPRSGCALSELLTLSLDQTKSKKSKKELLVDTLINLAIVKKDMRAISKIFDILIGDYQFQKKIEIEQRLELIEEKIDEVQATIR